MDRKCLRRVNERGGAHEECYREREHVRANERTRGRVCVREIERQWVCVSVLVSERNAYRQTDRQTEEGVERREGGREGGHPSIVQPYHCACVCVCCAGRHGDSMDALHGIAKWCTSTSCVEGEGDRKSVV